MMAVNNQTHRRRLRLVDREHTPARVAFQAANGLLMLLITLMCLLPIVNILAISFSSASAAEAGYVTFLPVKPTLAAYKYVANKIEFLRALFISVERVALALPLTMLVVVLMAYPMSKSARVFNARPAYVVILVFTMLFSGGLVPFYIIVSKLKLINSIWALVLPTLVPIYYIILLQNFFKDIPSELEEAAFIDGAGPWMVLFRVYVPLSKPALATIALFIIVGHWNSWFDGLILMNDPVKYPLQSYLQTVVTMPDVSLKHLTNDMKLRLNVAARNVRAAQIFLAAVPILLIYPFLQKYFAKGIVLGSVKG